MGAAIKFGRVSTVKLLLEWPENAPKANHNNGIALVDAVYSCHKYTESMDSNAEYYDIIKMLLDFPDNAADPNSRDGDALSLAITFRNEKSGDLLTSRMDPEMIDIAEANTTNGHKINWH